jgi:hypothetical protein
MQLLDVVPETRRGPPGLAKLGNYARILACAMIDPDPEHLATSLASARGCCEPNLDALINRMRFYRECGLPIPPEFGSILGVFLDAETLHHCLVSMEAARADEVAHEAATEVFRTMLEQFAPPFSNYQGLRAIIEDAVHAVLRKEAPFTL